MIARITAAALAALAVLTAGHVPAHASARHAHRCQAEARDTRTVRPGGLARFEVNDTCTLHGLFVLMAASDTVVLHGQTRRHGHDLTVAVRVPRQIKPGTVFYPFAYDLRDLYNPVAELAPVTVTR